MFNDIKGISSIKAFQTWVFAMKSFWGLFKSKLFIVKLVSKREKPRPNDAKERARLESISTFLMMLQQIIFMRAIKRNLWRTIICCFQVVLFPWSSWVCVLSSKPFLHSCYSEFAKTRETEGKNWNILLPFLLLFFRFELLYNEFLLTSSQVFLIIFNPFLILFYGYQKLYNFCTHSRSLRLYDWRKEFARNFKLKIYLERNEIVWH